MSLNGLDNVQVTQAYQGALAEAGGWFLLRYTSRDSVEVLTRGTGGAGEARAAVAAYEEKSPLYGLLLYRRRKVLVKYVPEGTSRLLQARVAVHFLTISEKFAPCDIVLSVSSPEELSDAALASACTLHTAAPSIASSSGSSRPQKLSWIQETAEEGPQPYDGDAVASSEPHLEDSAIPSTPERTISKEDVAPRTFSIISQTSGSVPIMLDEAIRAPPMPDSDNKAHGEEQEHATEAEADALVEPESDLKELQATLKSYDKLFETGHEPRLSSQTARPNYDELYEHYYAQYSKPKVKLGPRPRPSLDNKRPSTSGSGSQEVPKTKSSLPAGLRSAARRAADHKSSAKTRESSTIPSIAIPPPPPIPSTPDMPRSPVSPAHTSKSPVSVKSMPVSAYSSHHRSSGMTQEKTRLMKALELRKKQQRAQEEKKAKQHLGVAQSSKAPLQESTTQATKESSPSEAKAHDAIESEAGKENINLNAQTSLGDDASSSLGLQASGLVFANSQADGDDLNSAASVYSPISAQTQGSSAAPSTRPSSLSDDDKPAIDHTQPLAAPKDISTSDVVDEEHSVGSTPTVVPESTTPIPTVEVAPHMDEPRVATDLRAVDEINTISRQASNRESAMYLPASDVSQSDEVQIKRRNRESALLPPSSKRQSWYQTKENRRALLEPLHLSAENSEAEYLSDDSFMEELQSATLQEAKPMIVSKSPIAPFFSRKSTGPELSGSPGRASQSYQVISRVPSDTLVRKTSGGWPPPSNDNVVVAKKINVSSGISQRIKALAEKSNRESVSPSGTTNTLDTPTSTLAQRKSSFFATTPVETSPNSRPTTRLGSPSFLNNSTASTPDKQAQPVKATVYNVQRDVETPESVQVTARIVRDERTKLPTLAMPTESTPLDLHASPLIIDHQKPTWTPRSPTRGRTRTEPASPRAPSSHSREQSSSRASSESTWRTFGRRMSESKSVYSHDGEDKREDKKDKKDRKESRTSKMFKRMSSSMSSMPWKNSSSNLHMPEHDMRTTSLASLREPPPPVHVGDLNIQFPDTLLWKRRWVEIDSAGYLVLSPSKSNEKGAVKKFHLSDFRTPYPPDQDRQELPNSVVLDFVDGRTLQCACETYTSQAQVLQILREAHDAWLAYNQAL